MDEPFDSGRRTFLKASVAAGGGLLIGLYLPGASRLAEAAQTAGTFAPNAWIRIGRDDAVTVIVDKSEMGQGVLTALPMLVAEELEADWTRIRIEPAPAAPEYKHPMFGIQATGGSTSVRASWKPLREAGAAAREMLIAAAARDWGVPPSACRAEKGRVVHPPSGRRASFGALAEKAADFAPPRAPRLKEPNEFRLIGKPLARLDSADKTIGAAQFGLDVKLPGMLTAVVARCPVFGGRLASFDGEKAKAVPGVRQVVQIDSGVAVVADGFWAAKRGRDALELKWDEGPNAGLSSEGIRKLYAEAAQGPGVSVRGEGNAQEAMDKVASRLEAVYEVPFLAHATMEPMNCTAWVRPGEVEIWTGTQSQTVNQQVASQIAGVKPEQVKVHTTLLGGGFGRRFEQDFVAEAVQISKLVGVPVKLVYTREDDMQHDFYRPATYNRMACGLDANGALLVWTHRIVAPSILTRVFPDQVKGGVDNTSIEGAANLPYAIPNIAVDYVTKETGVPVGFWRSVGSSQNAFVTECFLDEAAAAAGKDPFEFRRALLAGHPRHRAALELAAGKAGWGKPLPKGRHRGIAVHESFGSFVAQVAEISVSDAGEVKVHRVVCAVDCGIVVNPAIVRAQMESGIVFGLTAALKGEITLRNGRVEQSNFHDYPMLRIDEMPVVEVHIVPSAEAPGGVGEPGVPPIAPAVCNAIFAATGKRIRTLPIRLSSGRKQA